MHWENTTEIDTPVDAMWAITLDVDALPDISPTMTAVERLTPGDLAPGSEVRIKQPGQPARVWTVTTVEAPHRFVWQTKVGPATMVATHALEATGDGATRNTLRIDLTVAAIAPASAQKPLCKPCQASGERCCGLLGSVQACIQCSLGYGFTNPEPWCRKNQPVCSKR